MTAEIAPNSAPWPFMRHDPTCIVLPVRDGAAASAKPPVRIFLGTEEAQYRAERIFFYSIEKVRDPGRVYEIYLMKNIEGFDRRRWRTGFTNYRYAIPEFAGGKGRAIYNDVDQIYLSDPALLFDLEMGKHGYMAISAKDTSVMVMDCEAMLPMWNRQTAAKLGKHELINKPSTTPGLWGELDGQWNARDQEYIEGRTHCLHYTALHQQPWEPFPDDYSYHPNPLAYIWHDLEREADIEGYQLFSETSPSPDFAPVTRQAGTECGIKPSEQTLNLFNQLNIQDCLIAHTANGHSSLRLPSLEEQTSLIVDSAANWPAKAADAVVIGSLLYDLPPADLPWVLDKLFDAAKQLVYVQIPKTSPAGMGSVAWWELRLRETARSHPGIHIQIDALDASADLPGTITSIQIRKRPAETPEVWTLASGDQALDHGLAAIAAELGANPRHVDAQSSLPDGRPDLILSADKTSAAQALTARQQGSARRVAQFGHTGLPVQAFDLVVSSPDERIPIRPNVMHVPVMPAIAANTIAGEGPLLVVSRAKGYRFDASRLTGACRDKSDLRIWFSADMASETRRELIGELSATDVSNEPLDGLIAGASLAILTVDQTRAMTIAARSNTPIELIPLAPWHSKIPGASMLVNLLTLMAGGGNSYRGTPHQQHFIARAIDQMVIRKGLRLPRDEARLHRALTGRGLAQWSGKTQAMASAKPLDDTKQIADKLRQLLEEDVLRESKRAA